MRSVRFNYSDRLIKKSFLTNDGDPLTIAQGNFPNCALISFFISMSHADIRIQKMFLSKTIVLGKQNGKKGFYVREFVPLKLSGKYRFISLAELELLTKHKGTVGSLLGHRERGNEIGTISMCGPLLMRAIECCWVSDLKNENSGQIKPMRIIDYIKKCGMNGEAHIIEGNTKRLDFAHHFAASDWIGWIKFDNEHINKNGYLLTNKHGYSVLGVRNNNLTVANPRYYNQGDKRTIIDVDYEMEGLSGFFYILH